MHEIITLQFGQRSNYAATHFWNAQESYFTYSDQEESLVNHDIHFRTGQASDGTDTYTPRTVIYDLKGGFGSLRKINALYDINDDTTPITGLWDGSTTRHHETPIAPSPYQTRLEQGFPTFQLHDRDVRYWSDFNRVFYHPRSAVQLSQYELNSQLMPFEKWTVGEELFDQLDKESDLLDRDVRPFAEECDHMQGMQLITGADDAWGGYASKYLESLRDEYGKTSLWVFGIEDTARANRQTQLLRSMNSAYSLRAFGQQGSTYVRLATVPAGLPRYANLNSTSDWMTSALLSSALETATLSTRLTQSAANQQQPASLSLLEDTLNINGNQNIFELQMSLNNATPQTPSGHSYGHSNGIYDEDSTTEPSPLDIDMTPTPTTTTSTTHSSPTSRKHQFARISTQRSHLLHPSSPSLTPSELTRRRQNDETIVSHYATPLLYPRLDSFPHELFRTTTPRGTSTIGLELQTALIMTSATQARVLRLRDDAVRVMAVEEREVVYDELTEVAGRYGVGWESGSDGDGDGDGEDE